MKILKTMACVACLGVVMSFTSSANAGATIEIDDSGTPGGTLSYVSGGSLVGTDIVLDKALGNGTPAMSGVLGALTIEGGDLDFTTGPLASSGVAGPLSILTWGPGGSFTVTATGVKDSASTYIIGSAGNVVPIIILSGSFKDAIASAGGSGTVNIGSTGVDWKHPAIETHFGFPVDSNWLFANTEISAVLTGDPSILGGFTASVSSADVTNATPEPGTFAIWGLIGASCAAASFYRKRRAA